MNWNLLKQHKLVVYSTGWCPDCVRFKRVLDRQNLEYAEIDIDADSAAATRLAEKTGRTAIPYLEIDDGPMIRGWHDGQPGKFSEEIFFAEVAEALAEK